MAAYQVRFKMALFIDGVRTVDLGNLRNEKKLEREIFLKKNPECQLSAFDDFASETSSIASFNVRPSPHFHVKRNDLEQCEPSKEKSVPLTLKHKKTLDLQALWAKGGPVKLLKFPCDEAQGTVCFKNYEHLNPERVRDLILSTGCSFLSLKEVGDDVIKVRLKTEDDTRKLYNFLKRQDEYDVIVLLDLGNYQASKKKEFQFKKLAKLRGHKYTNCHFHKEISEKDALSRIDKINKLDAQIKFDIKPSPSLLYRHRDNSKRIAYRECSSSSSYYSDEDVPRNQLGRLGSKWSGDIKYSDNETQEKPLIGTWNGHIVIKPAIPAPILSKRPPLIEKKREDSVRMPFPQKCNDKNTYLLKYSSNSTLLDDANSSDELSDGFLTSVTEKSSSDTPQEVLVCSVVKSSNNSRKVQKPYQRSIRNWQDFQPEKCACSTRSPSTEYPSSRSREIFNQSLRVGNHLVEGEEADEPKLISIFDIFMQVMKRNILNNLETSFAVIKK